MMEKAIKKDIKTHKYLYLRALTNLVTGEAAAAAESP
jgi:hypothetical protein